MIKININSILTIKFEKFLKNFNIKFNFINIKCRKIKS